MASKVFVFFLVATSLFGCTQQGATTAQTNVQTNRVQLTKVSDIPLPQGYRRIEANVNSHTHFLRNLELSTDNTVYLYNGEKKRNQSAQYAVLSLDIGDRDLQQCADAAMRLRAEYLYARKNYDSIGFRFTNGFYCSYRKYAEGNRVKISGGSCSWVKTAKPNYDYGTFRQYLTLVYSYAGTKSLHQEMTSIPISKIAPGKVFLQTREPYGHAVTVMDMAYNATTKDTIYLLSQSYMPAQSIHILVNPDNERLSPWYSVKGNKTINTPEWTFYQSDLKSF